jgi:arylsulfatase A-like enzyme
MRSTRFPKLVWLVVCFYVFCFQPSARATEAAYRGRPNIVVLLADDVGYGELGCQGNPQIPTPHIDSIAQAGIRFTDAYVTASVCSPSRAGLMTGRYQTRFGYEINPIGARNEDPSVGLPQSERTLAQHLHDAGYATGLFGKWHLGGRAAYHPMRRGFDEFFGFMHEGHYYAPPPYSGLATWLRRRALPDGGRGRWMNADGTLILSTHMGYNEPIYDADNPILRDSQPVIEPAYLTRALTREAVDFIGRNKERPFFLYLAYNAVHSPLQAPLTTMERFGHIEDIHRRIFAGMLVELDDGVGAVLKKLRDEGLEDNTLLVFFSDNGGATRELTSSNAPLRGEKGDLYEGGIRVPFLIRWPGRLPAGATETRPVIALDVFPTAAAAAGVAIPPNLQLDGVNLLPYLSGEESGRPHDVLYWRMMQKAALRSGDWKLVRNPGRGENADWKLFNLADDVGEKNDLAATQPQKLRELVRHWEQINAEMAEPIPAIK